MARYDPIPDLKREAAARLVDALEGTSVQLAAALLGTDPRRVTEIRHGRLDRFSLEKLIRHLARVNRGVILSVVKGRVQPLERKQRQ